MPIFQVIAVLYNVGAHNVYLDKLGWGSLPAVNGDFAEVNSAFNPTYLLPASRSYFAYVGSLTSPPCTERARWVVMESPASLSPAQVAQIPNNGNFRPLQPLGSRQVVTANPLTVARVCTCDECMRVVHVGLQCRSSACLALKLRMIRPVLSFLGGTTGSLLGL